MSAAETQAFRKALGTFPTGVTIVTTSAAAGPADSDAVQNGSHPVGVTASSFNSVSIDPPLVLWSLAKNSLSHDAFCASGHFAIHVLADTQTELSNRFARSGGDKFEGVSWVPGTLGSPVLNDYAAMFECRTQHIYEGGDHTIFVGEVVAHEAHDHAPLVFHDGNYARSGPHGAPDNSGQGGKSELTVLLTRAYVQMIGRTGGVAGGGLGDASVTEHFTADELEAGKAFLRRIASLTGN